MPSDDHTLERDALRASKDRVVSSVIAEASASGIRVLRGGGAVFARHSLISPRRTPWASLIVDPPQLGRFISHLRDEGWHSRFPGRSAQLLPHTIVRMARPDIERTLHLHGLIPGFFADPARTFDVFWQRRSSMILGGAPMDILDRLCTVLLSSHDRLSGQRFRTETGGHFDYLLSQFQSVLTTEERLRLLELARQVGAQDELRSLLEGLGLDVGAATPPTDAYIRSRLGITSVRAGERWIVERLERPLAEQKHRARVGEIAVALPRLAGARKRVAERDGL